MTLPAHIPIPTHWTADQAELVLRLVEQISRAIWQQYEHPLVEKFARAAHEDSGEPPVDDLDDGPPF